MVVENIFTQQAALDTCSVQICTCLSPKIQVHPNIIIRAIYTFKAAGIRQEFPIFDIYQGVKWLLKSEETMENVSNIDTWHSSGEPNLKMG